MHPDLFLNWNDLLGVLICFIFSLGFLYYFRIRITDPVTYKEFRTGFYLRMLGAFAYAIFNLYYIKADGSKYFAGAKIVADVMRHASFSDTLKMFFSDFYELPIRVKQFFSNDFVINEVYNDHLTMLHISGVISFFTFDSYLAIAFFLTLWSYIGIWLIYRTALVYYPKAQKWLFYIMIAYPPLWFWTTGLMKEPICMGALGVLFCFFFNKEARKKRPILLLLLTLFSAYLLIQVKSYLLISFLVAAGLAYLINSIHKISVTQKWIVYVSLITILFMLLFVYSDFIEQQLAKVFTDEFTDRIKTTTGVQLMQGGSSYDLGEIDISGWGMFTYAAAALNVALFRPYPWEYLNPMVLAASLESMAMLFMLLFLFIKVGPLNIRRIAIDSPVLLFSFFFTIFTAIMAGGIAFNFGTLIRYKIPLIPFYFIFIICIYYRHQQNLMDEKSSPSAIKH